MNAGNTTVARIPFPMQKAQTVMNIILPQKAKGGMTYAADLVLAGTRSSSLHCKSRTLQVIPHGIENGGRAT